MNSSSLTLALSLSNVFRSFKDCPMNGVSETCGFFKPPNTPRPYPVLCGASVLALTGWDGIAFNWAICQLIRHCGSFGTARSTHTIATKREQCLINKHYQAQSENRAPFECCYNSVFSAWTRWEPDRGLELELVSDALHAYPCFNVSTAAISSPIGFDHNRDSSSNVFACLMPDWLVKCELFGASLKQHNSLPNPRLCEKYSRAECVYKTCAALQVLFAGRKQG